MALSKCTHKCQRALSLDITFDKCITIYEKKFRNNTASANARVINPFFFFHIDTYIYSFLYDIVLFPYVQKDCSF